MSSAPISRRIAALGGTMAPLMRFNTQSSYARLAGQPEVSDFTFGNPHEMPLPGLVTALQRHALPENQDWFAYKRSEPESQAILAASLREWRGLPFEPDDIALTNAGAAALAVALKAVTEPGDEVIFSLPPWFAYEFMCVDAGLVPVKVRHEPVTLDLDLDAIAAAITPRTRVVIVNTPCNPTGRIYPPATLAALARLLTEASHRNGRAIYILSDEPYSRIVFDGRRFHSPSEHYPNTMIAYSYGKVLLAPGQRIGFLALAPAMPDREQVRASVFLAQFATGYAFPNALLQHALADLDKLSIDIGHLQDKRDWLVRELRAMGYEVHVPEGTFYLFPRAPLADDEAFTELLAEHRVLAIPGAAFEWPGYFRLSLTANDAMIARALPGFAGAIRRARELA